MKWERMSTWAQISDCGRYTVSAAQHAETIGKKRIKRFLFTAWLRSADSKLPPSILLVDPSAEVCRQKCVAHAQTT